MNVDLTNPSSLIPENLPRAHNLYGDASRRWIYDATFRQWAFNAANTIPRGARVKLFFLSPDRTAGEFLWATVVKKFDDKVEAKQGGDPTHERPELLEGTALANCLYMGQLESSAMGASKLRYGDLVVFHRVEVMAMEATELQVRRAWKGDATDMGVAG